MAPRRDRARVGVIFHSSLGSALWPLDVIRGAIWRSSMGTVIVVTIAVTTSAENKLATMRFS